MHLGSALKAIRYLMLYGFSRTLVKGLYQLKYTRISLILLPLFFRYKTKQSDKRIVLIGLGNQGFTLIAYFLCVIKRQRIAVVIDPSDRARLFAKKVLKSKYFESLEDAKNESEFHGDIVYIASDHATHMHYAISALETFRAIYIEKPLFVNREDIDNMKTLTSQDKVGIFTGYNRPHAPFFKLLVSELENSKFRCSFIVNGHFLDNEHWYRQEGQGSRILGNGTHWIDMAYRLLDTTEELEVIISKGVDDSIGINFTDHTGNQVHLAFSAFKEPRNGVEEFIFWNSSRSLGSINNFIEMKIVDQGRNHKISRFKKDVGHGNAVIFPLTNALDYQDIAGIQSAILAVEIEENVQAGVHKFLFSHSARTKT